MQTLHGTKTHVYHKMCQSAAQRIVVHEGGARSSKTYSICQYLIERALNEELTITIARSRFTWLKNTVMADFFGILDAEGLYEPKNHRKTENMYLLGNSTVQFIGLDESQKLRGRKQHIFWINEANECLEDDFRQAALRTTQQLVLDYNPSDEFHWIYDKVLTRPDCTLIKSTYRDNPFLPAELRKEIEALEAVDENYWRVFGLGLRGKSDVAVYRNFEFFTAPAPSAGRKAYGLDFGYNAPTALVEVQYHENTLYWSELIYQRYLTMPDLVQLLKQLNISKSTPIYADTASPEKIAALQLAGYNCQGANKTVTPGILAIKACNLRINGSSTNLVKEIKQYQWQKHANGHILDEPVKFLDHALDAARYASVKLLDKRPTTATPFLVKGR